MAQALFARYDDNILLGGTITASAAPLTSYDLGTLGSLSPASRVRFGTDTVTLHWALPTAKRGDVLVIPVSNLDNGALTLTNDAGLSVNIPVPAMPLDRIPLTIVVDLRTLEPDASTRTSSDWYPTIAGNAVDVTLGGAVAIYSDARPIDPDIGWSFSESEKRAVSEAPNDFLTRYLVDYDARERTFTCSARVTIEQRESLKAWHRANRGSARPSLLWLDPDIADGYFGTLQPEFRWSSVPHSPYFDVALQFRELSKGQSV